MFPNSVLNKMKYKTLKIIQNAFRVISIAPVDTAYRKSPDATMNSTAQMKVMRRIAVSWYRFIYVKNQKRNQIAKTNKTFPFTRILLFFSQNVSKKTTDFNVAMETVFTTSLNATANETVGTEVMKPIVEKSYYNGSSLLCLTYSTLDDIYCYLIRSQLCELVFSKIWRQ